MQTLLIVDDEVLIAQGLHAMLAQAFAGRLQVLCCYSAAQALDIAEQTRVDILLTDINMPDISGLELHEKLMRKHPDCQVIYLTGYSDFEYARKALDQHAFAYVLKGEGDDFVISTVERAMKKEAPASASAAQPEKETEWIQALHTYIHAHLNEDENTGMTLSDYINQCRQEQAEQLLRNSRMTVLEISRLMGFATDNYFCRWFRKRTGISPHSFRNGK